MKKPLMKSRLVMKKYLTPDMLMASLQADLNFAPGQFFHIILDEQNPNDEVLGFRPYSILNTPEQARVRHELDIFVKLFPAGLASKFLENLDVGKEIFIRGPYGRFALDESNNKHIFFCAGTGVAPVNSIINARIGRGDDFVLFQSAKTKDALLYYDEFMKLSKEHGNFHYFPTLTKNNDDQWKGLIGRIEEHIHAAGDLTEKTAYICGGKEFVSALLAATKGKAKNIIMERYN